MVLEYEWWASVVVACCRLLMFKACSVYKYKFIARRLLIINWVERQALDNDLKVYCYYTVSSISESDFINRCEDFWC